MKLTNKETGKEYEFVNEGDYTYIGRLIPIKPELKKIDMPVCIESKILCLFTKTSPVYGERVQFLALYSAVLNHQVKKGELYATPYMDGYIHASSTGWDKRPIPEGFDYTWWGMGRNGVSTNKPLLNWGDVRMFEITGIAEGWKL